MDEIADAEPFAPFSRWYAEAQKREPDPHAVALATATRDGLPSARMVLLKGFDTEGFVFYTNLESRKSAELSENPHAALCFLWKVLRRQVRIEGVARQVAGTEADAYFASRPRDSRIGAWASDQSRPLEGRDALERRFEAFAQRFGDGPGEVPRPTFWSGFRIVPQRIEFWQERPSRLHDRWLFVREDERWRRQRLYP